MNALLLQESVERPLPLVNLRGSVLSCYNSPMLTDTDFKRIQKLLLTLPGKEDFHRVEERLTNVESSLRSLTVSVEKFVKVAADLREENAAISVQLTRHERWFKELAKKTGISLEI